MDYVLDQRCGGCTIDMKNCSQCIGNLRAGIRRRKGRATAFNAVEHSCQPDSNEPIVMYPE